MFVWDVISNNQLFGSYIMIKLDKDNTPLKATEIDEVIKMCYAGAAATIDNILGIKLTDKEKDMLEKFKEAKINLKKEQPNA